MIASFPVNFHTISKYTA